MAAAAAKSHLQASLALLASSPEFLFPPAVKTAAAATQETQATLANQLLVAQPLNQ